MAKGKYHEWLKPEGLTRIQGWAMDGLTIEEIAAQIRINPDTLYTWMNRFPEISDAIKNNKDVADRLVEQALFNKALGRCKVTETVKERRLNVKTGEYELVVVKETIKGVPPDVAAQVFWLKNRKPNTWRDKREVETEAHVTAFDQVSEVTAQILQADEDRNLDDFLTEDGDHDE